jgi:PAS domain S-box-containing protein
MGTLFLNGGTSTLKLNAATSFDGKLRFRRLLVIAGLRLAVLGFVTCMAAYPISLVAQAKARNVLLMFTFYERDQTQLNAIEAAVRAHVPGPVNFLVEYLESPRFEEKPYRDSLAEMLQQEYEGKKPDLVLAASEPALRFAVQYRDTMFPGTPIVFWEISSGLAFQKMPGVTGVATPPGTHDTIDLALRLQPDTTTVAVISGVTEIEQYWLKEVHQELLRHQDKVKEIDIVGPPGADLLQRIAALPPHTEILFQLNPEDLIQPAISNWDVLAAASQRFPTYSIFSLLALDHGGIGGAYFERGEDAAAAGELAGRVLSGESPDNIPVVRIRDLKIKVDWRQLQRWHIPISALPPGSIVLNRQPTLWKQYKGYVVAGITLILLEAALIIALVWNRARRRRSEKELAIIYDRLRMAVEAATSVGWDADYKRGKNRWFGDVQTMFGLSGGHHEVSVGDFLQRVHADDRERVGAAIERAKQNRDPYAAEFRVIRTDGTLRWISARGKFYYAPNGQPERMLGMATDVTERKVAEEALNRLSGQLINAQEEERRRIAREIHDDFQQRLAVLAIELESLYEEIGEKDAIALVQLRDLALQAHALGADLHSLSHRLHSSTLDSMGLVPALKGLCSEFRKHHDLEVSLVAENVPRKIPNETALCLFRIAQEAIQNARKHSRVRSAEVRVEGLEGTVHLSITDSGIGFDRQEAVREGGIGIRSMEERARLVNGRLQVRSKPGSGTMVEIWVPVPVSERSVLEV